MRPFSSALSSFPRSSSGRVSEAAELVAVSFSFASNSSSVFGPSVTSGEPWSSPGFGASKSCPSSSLALARAAAKSAGIVAVEPVCAESARTVLVPKKAAPIITEATPSENFRILYLQRFSNNPLSIGFLVPFSLSSKRLHFILKKYPPQFLNTTR